MASASVDATKMVDGAALAEILDDDGAGSLLDADKLDGVEGSGYASAAAGVTNGNAHDHVGGDGAAIPAGGLADGAVNTTAKLANDIVDDTKAGDRVPQFYRRQGGSATDWNTDGATNYTPGAVRMQAGIITCNANGNTVITFPVAFSAKPLVLWGWTFGGTPSWLSVAALPTASGFTINNSSPSIATNGVWWVAIGPE
jgi:hypothetical protein